MSSDFQIEFSPPSESNPCPCCDRITISLARFVEWRGCPCAIVSIAFSEGHPEIPATAIVGVGSFGEGSSKDERVAFAMELLPQGVFLVDATEEQWPRSEILGAKLSRAEALEHPLKPNLFAIVDELYLHDGPLLDHFHRAQHAGES